MLQHCLQPRVCYVLQLRGVFAACGLLCFGLLWQLLQLLRHILLQGVYLPWVLRGEPLTCQSLADV